MILAKHASSPVKYPQIACSSVPFDDKDITEQFDQTVDENHMVDRLCCHPLSLLRLCMLRTLREY